MPEYLEASKCRLELLSGIFCQKHNVKPDTSPVKWLKLTPRSLREGLDPKYVATGSDGNLNVVKSELLDLGMLSKSSKCPSLPAGSIALVWEGWL